MKITLKHYKNVTQTIIASVKITDNVSAVSQYNMLVKFKNSQEPQTLKFGVYIQTYCAL